MSLDNPVQKTPILRQTKIEIIHGLWPRPSKTRLRHEDLDWEAYFTYYTQECLQALQHNGRYISARSHRHMLSTAELIRNGDSKEAVKQRLREKLETSRPTNEEENMVEGSTRLAARLLCMMDIGTLPFGFSGRPHVAWTQGSLKDCVHSYFDTLPEMGHEQVKLETNFTAGNLTRIAGMQFVWTDNLADHLRLVESDKQICIFHHASFLKWCESDIFPEGLVEETLSTFALLFPQSDPETQKWFQKLTVAPKGSTGYVLVDRQIVKCGQLRAERRQLKNFRFWHDRLVILKQVFDESRPATLSQWWHDRRNGVQWSTFWVAILVLVLTFFFGVIQSIEGGMQVYMAYRTPPA